MEKINKLKFTKTHEWLDQNDVSCVVGITDHAQQMLGDVVFVDLKKTGEKVTQGESIGVVESVKAASDIYAPVSGEIMEVNQELIDNPAILNEDPFGRGWLVKIQPDNLSQINELLDDAQYSNQIKESE